MLNFLLKIASLPFFVTNLRNFESSKDKAIPEVIISLRPISRPKRKPIEGSNLHSKGTSASAPLRLIKKRRAS